jgi:hypothetical protein
MSSGSVYVSSRFEGQLGQAMVTAKAAMDSARGPMRAIVGSAIDGPVDRLSMAQVPGALAPLPRMARRDRPQHVGSELDDSKMS